MLFISLTEIYTGIVFIAFMNDESWAMRGPVLDAANAVVNIIYEINTILITWIVGF